MASATDSAIRKAKDAMFLDSAVESDLARLGSMFGVPWFHALGRDDELYRKLVQLLAFQPKLVMKIVHDLLGVLFGSREQLIANNVRPWEVYEVVCGEIVVEIPLAFTSGTLINATYLHGAGGDGNGFTLAAADAFYVYGSQIMSVDLVVGLQAQIGLPGSDLSAYQITGFAYDAALERNELQVAPATLPTNMNGLAWRISVPAAMSYAGDYLLHDATRSGASADDNIVVLFGSGLIKSFQHYMTRLVKASGVRLRIERI